MYLKNLTNFLKIETKGFNISKFHFENSYQKLFTKLQADARKRDVFLHRIFLNQNP